MNRLIKPFLVIFLAFCLATLIFAVERSSQWDKARAAHLKVESVCQWCGCKDTKKLQVHHILMVARHPQYELIDSEDGKRGNMITLCNNCHLPFGHNGDFHNENPFIREECEMHQRLKLKYAEKTRQLERSYIREGLCLSVE